MHFCCTARPCFVVCIFHADDIAIRSVPCGSCPHMDGVASQPGRARHPVLPDHQRVQQRHGMLQVLHRPQAPQVQTGGPVQLTGLGVSQKSLKAKRKNLGLSLWNRPGYHPGYELCWVMISQIPLGCMIFASHGNVPTAWESWSL